MDYNLCLILFYIETIQLICSECLGQGSQTWLHVRIVWELSTKLSFLIPKLYLTLCELESLGVAPME